MKKVSGFSLLETVIALGIASIGAYVLLQTNTNSLKAQKSAELNSDLVQFDSIFQQILVQDSCNANLVGLRFDTTNTTSRQLSNQIALYYSKPAPSPIPSNSPSVVIDTTKPFAVATPTPSSFGGWNVSGTGLTVIGPISSSSYLVKIEADMTKATSTSFGPTSQTRSVTITVNTTPVSGNTVQIAGCGSSKQSSPVLFSATLTNGNLNYWFATGVQVPDDVLDKCRIDSSAPNPGACQVIIQFYNANNYGTRSGGGGTATLSVIQVNSTQKMVYLTIPGYSGGAYASLLGNGVADCYLDTGDYGTGSSVDPGFSMSAYAYFNGFDEQIKNVAGGSYTYAGATADKGYYINNWLTPKEVRTIVIQKGY